MCYTEQTWVPTLLIGLETFLGGMETGIVSTILVVRKGLETFLGGMETPHVYTERVVSSVLETFLGGMETPEEERRRYGRKAP